VPARLAVQALLSPNTAPDEEFEKQLAIMTTHHVIACRIPMRTVADLPNEQMDALKILLRICRGCGCRAH